MFRRPPATTANERISAAYETCGHPRAHNTLPSGLLFVWLQPLFDYEGEEENWNQLTGHLKRRPTRTPIAHPAIRGVLRRLSRRQWRRVLTVIPLVSELATNKGARA